MRDLATFLRLGATLLVASGLGLPLAHASGCTRAAGAGAEDAVARGCDVVASIPYWDQDDALASFSRNAGLIDYLSLFWYHLDPEGEIRPYRRADTNRQVVEDAQRQGARVLALIANLPDDEREGEGLTWDPGRVWQVIRSRARRKAHIADILKLAEDMGFDGILIDYEALPRRQRDAFSAFVAELSAALHARDKLLAVAIHPKTGEGKPSEDNGSHAQDWQAISRHADQLHFMTYSQHTASSGPGPAASPAWVARVLRYAVRDRQVPPDKIFLGLPLYAQEWKERRSGGFRGLDRDLTFADARRRLAEHEGELGWSSEHATPFITYRGRKGKKHVIWFEDERSNRHKLELAAGLGVCHVALWRLGGEDPDVWELLRPPRPLPPKDGGPAPAGADDGDSGGDGGTTEPDPDAGEPDAAEADAGEPDAAEADASAPAADADVDQASDDGEGPETAAVTALAPQSADTPADESLEAEAEPSTPEGEEGIAVWHLSRGAHPSFPRLVGHTAADLEHYQRFATSPENERNQWMSNLHLEQRLDITPRLTIESDARAVLESDGEDRRFYSDYPYKGIYLRTLLAAYRGDHVALFAGKYEPAAHLRGRAPIFFGNYSTRLDYSGRVGGGAALSVGNAATGEHTLTAHWFRFDTTRLRGELISDRWREDEYYGVGPMGLPDSYLVTLDGHTVDTRLDLRYTLGAGRQRRGDTLPETAFFGALFGALPVSEGGGSFELSVDLFHMRNAGGYAEDTRTLLVGAGYSDWPRYLGAAYSVRDTDAMDGGQRRDHIAEIVARYGFGDHLILEAAYQRVREHGVTENALGIVARYGFEWMVH